VLVTHNNWFVPSVSTQLELGAIDGQSEVQEQAATPLRPRQPALAAGSAKYGSSQFGRCEREQERV
jgi:hypothetical protein